MQDTEKKEIIIIFHLCVNIQSTKMIICIETEERKGIIIICYFSVNIQDTERKDIIFLVCILQNYFRVVQKYARKIVSGYGEKNCPAVL